MIGSDNLVFPSGERAKLFDMRSVDQVANDEDSPAVRHLSGGSGAKR